MSTFIDSIKWKIQIAIAIIIGIIASCYQINSFTWGNEIKVLSIIFTIIAWIFSYVIILLIVEIYTIKDDIIEIKNRKSRK